MAHIEIRKNQLVINGVDFSMETYRGYEIVEVGEAEFAEVGFRVTFAVSRLDLDNEADVVLTDHVPTVAARVSSMQADD